MLISSNLSCHSNVDHIISSFPRYPLLLLSILHSSFLLSLSLSLSSVLFLFFLFQFLSPFPGYHLSFGRNRISRVIQTSTISYPLSQGILSSCCPYCIRPFSSLSPFLSLLCCFSSFFFNSFPRFPAIIFLLGACVCVCVCVCVLSNQTGGFTQWKDPHGKRRKAPAPGGRRKSGKQKRAQGSTTQTSSMQARPQCS